ncbi:unnamed protein product [Clonostachys rosea f. rosea IK726]|uniref:C3H1-type domain-containing protein n=2 Tax=Bionectria ochroleuca TaxID=29856 RepID=A0A0B7JYQ5_BIOOC|nr:unnamed protein product [Clonostachys rosea f. rosea IK726]
MAPETESTEFIQRFHDVQFKQDASTKLIKDLIAYCKHVETLTSENLRLSKENDGLKIDLAGAAESRKQLQQRAQVYENEYFRLRQGHVSNPYIAILIDGDGLIFQDKFVKGGVEGGKKAAQALRDAVAEQCNEMEISAKVVTSIRTLSKALIQDGVIEHWAELKDFTLGFTQSQPSFEFIDVGCDRESAETKIKETTKWHLQNLNCQQVLLGISHEASYAPFLNNILQNELSRQRVTVLEGVPTVKELVATRVNVFRMKHDIFRSDRLPDINAASPVESSPDLSRAVPPALTPPASASTASPFSSYADMAQKVKPASPPPQITLPLAPRSASVNPRSKQASQRPQTPQPKWKPGPRGYDEPIDINPVVLETVKKRKDSSKLCNNHFLRGPCTKGDGCSFVHKYKPTPDEIDAIAFLTRLNPCTLLQSCEAEECIYGHHCPSVKDNTCTHPFCKFPISSHPPGTKFKNVHIDKN